jgi:hypothetical protein
MDMVIGKLIQNKIVKDIKGIIYWIRNQVMESIPGKMVGIIRVTFKMIKDMDMESYLVQINVNTVVNGKKDKNCPNNL